MTIIHTHIHSFPITKIHTSCQRRSVVCQDRDGLFINTRKYCVFCSTFCIISPPYSIETLAESHPLPSVQVPICTAFGGFSDDYYNVL